MMIRDMFADDINRKINGVIKVDQAADDVIEQELNEYVITRELKKHFITFFNYYGDAFDQPTADMVLQREQRRQFCLILILRDSAIKIRLRFFVYLPKCSITIWDFMVKI